MSAIHLALAGNPNCGKTALFNALTGSTQRVGNWPGVTVDYKKGEFQYDHQDFSVVDLPGTYSLYTYSDHCGLDEKIACDYLLNQSVEVIVNVIDATNLERHLFLTTQLLGLHIPVVVAVNMLDILHKRGAAIDCGALAEQLGCPVVGIIASKRHNLDGLQQAIQLAAVKRAPAKTLDLPTPLLQAQQAIAAVITQAHSEKKRYASAIALQLLEGDMCIERDLSPAVLAEFKQQQSQLEPQYQAGVDLIIADQRYQWAHRARQAALTTSKTIKDTLTYRIDRVILNRYLGIPIFLLVMYCMFLFSINVGSVFQDFFDIGSSAIFVEGMAHLLLTLHCPNWLIAIIANGLGKGINTTVTFIPMIAALFLFLSFLEDSGYMARATFVMDRLMRMMGLPGEAFVPMIVGFGCNVPAVMGARTLANPRDRILTVMMMPFMSCGARFAIFTVFASAFFPLHGASIIFALYVLGVLAAVFTGFVMRKTCLPGSSAPLVMELPSYHRPQLSSILRLTKRRVKAFLFRAGKVIIPVCIVLGALNSISLQGHLLHGDANTQSLLSSLGRWLTPALEPMGSQPHNWPATVGLATGVLAKEVVVGTLNTLYSQQAHLVLHGDSLSLVAGLKAAWQSIPDNFAALTQAFANPIAANAAPVAVNDKVYGLMYQQFGGVAAAFSYLLFVLLYFPCISTLAVMRREVGKRWAALSMLWSCGFAYVAAVLCYQLLSFTQHMRSSSYWMLAMFLLSAIVVFVLRRSAHWLQQGAPL